MTKEKGPDKPVLFNLLNCQYLAGVIRPFFFKGAKCLGADLQGNFFAVDNQVLVCRLGFQTFLVWRWLKLTFAAVLLAFTGDVAYLHDFIPVA